MLAIVLDVGDAAVEFNATESQTVTVDVLFDLTAGEIESIAAYNAELEIAPISQGVAFSGAVAAPNPVINPSPQVFGTGNSLLVAANLNSGQQPINDGAGLFRAQLTIAAGTPAGQYVVSLDPANTVLVRGDASSITGVQFATGIITITSSDNAEISGRVWNDVNQNAIDDAGDTPAVGVTVRLLDAGDSSLLQSTTTAGDGTYAFADLPAGDYVVEVQRPGGLIFNAAHVGSNTAIDSDVAANGRTVVISLGGGETRADIDAALLPPPYQNTNPLDVDDSGVVTLNDALTVVSVLRNQGAHSLPLPPVARPPYLDPSGDNQITLNDALLVVGHLRQLAGSGEGESAAQEERVGSQAVSLPESATSLVDEALAQLATEREQRSLFLASWFARGSQATAK